MGKGTWDAGDPSLACSRHRATLAWLRPAGLEAHSHGSWNVVPSHLEGPQGWARRRGQKPALGATPHLEPQGASGVGRTLTVAGQGASPLLQGQGRRPRTLSGQTACEGCWARFPSSWDTEARGSRPPTITGGGRGHCLEGTCINWVAEWTEAAPTPAISSGCSPGEVRTQPSPQGQASVPLPGACQAQHLGASG